MAIITVTTLDDTAIAPDLQVSLREALQAANTDTSVDGSTAGSGTDTIVFDPSLSGTLTLAQGQLVISSDLTIDGDADGDDVADVTTDANNASRVFSISAGTSTLDALTITGGDAGASSGGGISNGGTLTLVNATVSGNDAAISGGGIFNGGTLTLVNAIVSGNDSQFGGGGIGNFGTLTLADSTLSDNSSSRGGGVANYGGTATLTNATLSGNRGSHAGGGLYNYGGTATLTNSIVAGNAAPNGADVHNFNASITYSGVNVFSQAGVGDADDTDSAALTDILPTSTSTPLPACSRACSPTMVGRSRPSRSCRAGWRTRPARPPRCRSTRTTSTGTA